MKDYDYVKVFSSDDYAEACLYVSGQKVLGIGEKMNEINEYAYMNGYNWEAFLNCYFAKKEPVFCAAFSSANLACLCFACLCYNGIH